VLLFVFISNGRPTRMSELRPLLMKRRGDFTKGWNAGAGLDASRGDRVRIRLCVDERRLCRGLS
jgi:hypothetical protein